MRCLHAALAVSVALSISSPSPVYTQQGGAGAAQPAAGRGQTPPRQWWANKDKGAQYGKNKPHIKLADLKARHKSQANWSEVVVEDENYHSTYNQGQPGTKIMPRMRPDTREFFVVVEGEMHADSAISEEIRNLVFPNSRLKGKANLLMMPNIDAANITYNLLKMTGGGVTVGPILVGNSRPAHILTNAATVRGIVNMTALSVVEAQETANAPAQMDLY